MRGARLGFAFLITCTARLPVLAATEFHLVAGETAPLTNGREIRARLEHQIDAVLDWNCIGADDGSICRLAAGDSAPGSRSFARIRGQWS
jgi:hypothetical protein